MRALCKILGVTLLMFITSVVGYANEFPPIDGNSVSRLEGVKESLVLKSRKGSKSLKNSAQQMRKQNLSPMRKAAAATSHVEGLQIWNPTQEYGKWWEFNTATAESSELWYSSMLANYNINCGFVKDGVLYAVDIENGYILTFNVATGEYVRYISLYDYNEMICQAAYDEENDIVYVYTYDSTGQAGFLFQRYDPETHTFELIREEIGEGTLYSDPLVAMAYNPIDKFIYGITLYGENWIKINPQNGEWTVVKKLDFQPASYVQAMVYTPTTYQFSYVGINISDETYHLVIDPETGEITSQTRMLDEAEYAILYCSDEALAKDAPAAPEIVSAEFDPATLSGKVKVAVPNKAAGGEDLSGTLRLVMTIDGEEYKTQDVEAGSEVELTIENQTEGAHKFAVYCVAANGTKGGKVEQDFWIGYDTPAAPQNVVLTETLVTWDAVTAGVYGQQLESDVITYNVYIQGEKINEAPIAATSYELSLEITELTKIQAEVEAVCGSKVSQRAASNDLVVGAYSLPLELEITKDIVPFITIVDANSDNSTWSWKSNAFQYDYNSSNAGDDWAILPKTNFPKEKQLYNISVDVSNYSRYPERFEIGISKTGKVEDMVIVVPATDVASDNAITLGGQFKLEEAGDYYIGIHAISDADCYYLRLHKVTATMLDTSNKVPQACADAVATAAEYGVLEATVAFTMPTLSLNEETLDIEKDIIVTLTSNVDTVVVAGKPGANVSGVIKTEQGDNVIKLTPENEFGVGLESTVGIYTGVDVPLPAVLTSVSVSADNRTVTFSWETGVEGLNGGFVDPAFVTYKVLLYDPERDYWFLEADCETTEYSYTVAEGTALTSVSLAVTSLNAAGYMENGPMVIASLGAPYEIPMLELFENQEFKYAPLTVEHPTEECSGSWDLVSPSQYVVGAGNETSAALRAYAKAEGNTSAQLALPKFNPQSEQEVVVKVRAYLYEGMANAEVFARGYNASYLLGTIAMDGKEAGWHEFEFMLPAEVRELQWAELVINAKFSVDAEYLLIDKYEITVFTGIESVVDSEAVIYATDKAIVFEHVTIGDEVSVFTPNGQTIMNEKAQNNQVVCGVNVGIYIVRCGNKMQKIIVK